MEEVIRRADSAPLWIYGNVIKSTPGSVFDTESYFIQLLESWQRIEKLAVLIHGRQISEEITHHFLRPAPILKLFEIHLPDVDADYTLLLPNLQSRSLFADYAPSLMEINAEKVAFKVNSSWLLNVSEVNSIPRRMTVLEALTLLQHTPLLETFSMGNTSDVAWNPTQPVWPKHIFRNLSVIYLTTTLPVCATILDHVSPAKLSLLQIETSKYDGQNDYVLSSLKDNLPIYISSYFTTNPTTSIDFSFPGFDFTDIDGHSSAFDQDHVFKIHINNYNDTLSACLLDAFTQSSYQDGGPFLFNSVTDLKVNLPAVVQPTISAKLYSMLAAFQHVQNLEINEHSPQALWSLSCIENQQLVLFPELHTVHLTSPYNGDVGTLMVDCLLKFLLKRRQIAPPVTPVATLDLTAFDHTLIRDFSAFDQVHGLTVVWKQESESGYGHEACSYVCGTGMPEKLNMRRRLGRWFMF